MTIPLTFIVLLFVGDASSTTGYGNNTSHHYVASSYSSSSFPPSSSLYYMQSSDIKMPNVVSPPSSLSSLLSLIPLVHTQAGANAVVTGLWTSLLLGDLLSLLVAYGRVCVDIRLGLGLGPGSDWESIEDQCRDRIASRVP